MCTLLVIAIDKYILTKMSILLVATTPAPGEFNGDPFDK